MGGVGGGLALALYTQVWLVGGGAFRLDEICFMQ